MPLSEQAARLLASATEPLPLVQADFAHPAQLPATVDSPPDLFPGARQPHAAWAGLLLRLGHWEDSHTVSQDDSTAEGSYWHGIVHRMEPDYFNANYWFKRVGQHAVYPALAQRAQTICEHAGVSQWRVTNIWSPSQFVTWCEEARAQGGAAKLAAVQIQMAEWQLLFDWCAGN